MILIQRLKSGVEGDPVIPSGLGAGEPTESLRGGADRGGWCGFLGILLTASTGSLVPLYRLQWTY